MMELFKRLNKEHKKTVILVTHDYDNVIKYCDNVVVMEKGEIIYYDTKEKLFSSDELLHKYKLNPPAIIHLQQELLKRNIPLKKRFFDNDELISELMRAKG